MKMSGSQSRMERWSDGHPRPSSWAKPGSALGAIKQTLALLRAILREIFDESAYQRFLSQHHLATSADAYAAFCHDHEHSKARRPRCC